MQGHPVLCGELEAGQPAQYQTMSVHLGLGTKGKREATERGKEGRKKVNK